MARNTDRIDPKGLIYESYRIDGIGAPECWSIFLDWAISAPEGDDSLAMIRKLLVRYGTENPDHPMTVVLKAALEPQTGGIRRGGARGRRRDA